MGDGNLEMSRWSKFVPELARLAAICHQHSVKNDALSTICVAMSVVDRVSDLLGDPCPSVSPSFHPSEVSVSLVV